MALPRKKQVWMPGQLHHCQEMCICMNEVLNPECYKERVAQASPSLLAAAEEVFVYLFFS